MNEQTCFSTRKLNNGWRVAARVVRGQLEAYKFVNVTQARKMVDKLNSMETVPSAAWVVTAGYPFYARLDSVALDPAA